MTPDGGVSDPTEPDQEVSGNPAAPGAIVGNATAYQTDGGKFILTDGTNGGWVTVWDPADLEGNR